MQSLLDVMSIRGDDDVVHFQSFWDRLEESNIVIEVAEDLVQDIDPTLAPRLDAGYASLKDTVERILTIAAGLSFQVNDSSGINDTLEGFEKLKCRFTRLMNMTNVTLDFNILLDNVNETNEILEYVLNGLTRFNTFTVDGFLDKVNDVYNNVQNSIEIIEEHLKIYPKLENEYNILLHDWGRLLSFLYSIKNITLTSVADVTVPDMQSQDLYTDVDQS